MIQNNFRTDYNLFCITLMCYILNVKLLQKFMISYNNACFKLVIYKLNVNQTVTITKSNLHKVLKAKRSKERT